MPNRILRDWTDSETIDSLDVNSERFFTRLIMKVDDFGRFTANTKLLRSALFPLKNEIRETDISRWLAACEKAGLVALYVIGSKAYLQVNNFNQRLRQKVEKYPPPTDGSHMTVICQSIDGVKRREVEVETEVETKSKGSGRPREKQDVIDFFITEGSNYLEAMNFWDYYSANGWVVTKARTPMKDWHASARSWIRRAPQFKIADRGRVENANMTGQTGN